MQEMTVSTLPLRWCGWARTGTRGRWRCLIHGAATQDEVMEQLRLLTARDKHVDLCVLPEGKSPDDSPGKGRPV
jgi:hypothetical protein